MGGTLIVTFSFLCFFLSQVLFSFASYWLSIWSGRRFDRSQGFFAWIEAYAAASLEASRKFLFFFFFFFFSTLVAVK